MNEPIFLAPVFQERIWGGRKLQDLFGYDIPNELTGECWAVSAHPNGQSIVKNGAYQGNTLGQLWSSHQELFHSDSPVFPLLTKILDASDNLSVQVHPDDEYAGKNENGELGKTECWYIVDAEPGAEIIYGHEAQSKEQLVQMMNDAKWDDLLTKIKVKRGDFFYVPSGTIHALGKGIVVLETQQSSDTTYRVYDYDRKDMMVMVENFIFKKPLMFLLCHKLMNPFPTKPLIKKELRLLSLYPMNFLLFRSGTLTEPLISLPILNIQSAA